MAAYRFVTEWRLAATIDQVWEAISRVDDWPAWWRDVVEARKLASGGADGVGAVHRLTWRTRLPYRLTFESQTVRSEPPRRLAARVSGEVVGSGTWELEAEGPDSTRIRYVWQVRTARAWMNLLAPLARPVFAWNHDAVMRRGGADLARRLGVPLPNGATAPPVTR